MQPELEGPGAGLSEGGFSRGGGAVCSPRLFLDWNPKFLFHQVGEVPLVLQVTDVAVECNKSNLWPAKNERSP